MAAGHAQPFQVGLQFLPAPDTCAATAEIFGYLAPFTDLWD
jgi:hypothetical protein